MNVVVSGMGAHCALGGSVKELWNGIAAGKSGIAPIKRFDVTPFEARLGALVPGGDDLKSDEERLLTYAIKAAAEALNDANISDTKPVSLVLGTSNGIRGKKIDEVSYQLAEALNLGGLVITCSTACTSSSHAIGFAADLLRRGRTRFVIAGGVDILTQDVFAGFHNLGLLSKTPCSPFSNTHGTTLGEGAAFLVMENSKTAKMRGVQPHAVFMGYGISADGFHDTKPDQSGTGICKAIAGSLTYSNLKASDMDYLNAHGSGTAANDSAEWRGIQCALSEHALHLPISSSKSFFGHAQGAAGALEAVTTLIALQHNVIPPTLNYIRPRPFSPPDPVAESKPRSCSAKYVISTNSGFGGVNSALIFGRKDIDTQLRNVGPRPISVLGYAQNTDKDYINRFIPYDDLRNADLPAKLLAGVIAMLLNDAGITYRSNECDPIGLFVGQDHLSAESLDALDMSIKERGIKHLSASAFTRLVINYPAGVSCRLFGIKGPVAAVAARPDNGLTALCLAADYLAWRNDTDVMIVASVDKQKSGEQATGILLKAGVEKSPIRLKGWSMDRNGDKATGDVYFLAGLNPGDINSVRVASFSDNPGLYELINTIEFAKNTHTRFCHLQSERNTRYMGIDLIIERINGYAT